MEHNAAFDAIANRARMEADDARINRCIFQGAHTMSEASDSLRAALFGGRNARIEEVEVELRDGKVRVGVKQPTLAAQGRLLNRLRSASKAENLEDLNKVKSDFAIQTVCDPSTGELILNERDSASMLSQPCGSWVDRVYTVAMRLMHASPQRTCAAEIEEPGADGAEPTKRVCGGELTVGAPHCPWCGAKVPPAAEGAEKNS